MQIGVCYPGKVDEDTELPSSVLDERGNSDLIHFLLQFPY
jgi:hypothetical protein